MFCNVGISDECQKEFLYKNCNLQELMKFKTQNSPEWINEYNAVSNIYKNIIVSYIDETPIIEMQTYLKNFKFIDFEEDDKTLDQYLKSESVKQYTIYDFKLKIFNYAVELVLELPLNLLNNKKLLEVYNINNNELENKDLYNCIRECIVKTESNENEAFITKSNEMAIKKVREIINKGYNLSINIDDFIIRSNTGNITAVSVIEESNQSKKDTFEEIIFNTNMTAERLEYRNKEFTEIYGCKCLFNGRFHTIITYDIEKENHFINTTYYAQFVWSYLNIMSYIIENLNISLQEEKHLTLSQENKNLISTMSEKINILSYEIDKFKFSIEYEYEHTYKQFEDSWLLKSTLVSQEKYISNLNSYLSQVQAEYDNVSDIKQNNILFVISMLQLLAMVSVWCDFLDLTNYDETPFTDLISNSNMFIVYFPIVSIFIITIMLLIITINKKK